MNSHPQLPLAVSGQIQMTFDNFYHSDASRVIETLRSAMPSPQESLIFIAGPKESGKSHLLFAFLNELEQSDPEAVPLYLSCKDLPPNADLIDLVSSTKWILLDDIDAWLSLEVVDPSVKEDSERLLFNLYNECKLRSVGLIMSASSVPLELPVELPDLRSRLQSLLLIRLSAPGDEEKLKILSSIAADKGFDLGREVAEYILKRSHRTMSDLFSLLSELDHASLSEKRKLTIPFVKKTLNW